MRRDRAVSMARIRMLILGSLDVIQCRFLVSMIIRHCQTRCLPRNRRSTISSLARQAWRSM
jgi:hypothetical protein